MRVRALAAELNSEVVNRGRSLAQLELAAGDLAERDRPLLRAMLAGSLRWHHRLEWQLGQLLDRPVARRDRLLGSLLRIGLTQIQILRIPEHAAVSATVAAADSLRLGRARGLVNAVLRRFLRERDQLDAAMGDIEPALYSHPQWLIDALRQDWPQQWQAILEAGNAMPPLWLRVNRTRIERDAYLALLETGHMQAAAAADLSDAVLLSEPVPVERLPGFADGLVSVQDAAAQRVAGLLDVQPGQRVLDVCAAPGGKTAHLLEHCPDLAELVAVDNDAERLGRIRENLVRLGLAATVLQGDAANPAEWFTGAAFDRILVDAPCSATGVIRRHPDIKLLRRADDLPELVALQRRILDALWPLLKPGGRLVYVTCSMLRAENTAVVDGFAADHRDAQLPEFGSNLHYQNVTGAANADGFYYACLTRAGGG